MGPEQPAASDTDAICGISPLAHIGSSGYDVLMTRNSSPQPKTIDSKGRVTLGKHFANRTALVRYISKNEVVVKLARVIPEDEAWLYENEEALTAVQRGLSQAASGRFAKPPDLDADSKLADQIEDA